MEHLTIADKARAVSDIGDECLTRCAMVIEGSEKLIDHLMSAIETRQHGLEHVVCNAQYNATKLTQSLMSEVQVLADDSYNLMLRTYHDLDPNANPSPHLEYNSLMIKSPKTLTEMADRIRLGNVGPLTTRILASRRRGYESPIDIRQLCRTNDRTPGFERRTKRPRSQARAEQVAGWLPEAGPVLYKDKLATQPNQVLEPPLREWVDMNLVRRWIQQCNDNHSKHCNLSQRSQLVFHEWPKWLIDTERKRLVPGHAADKYVTLSYAWGDVKRLFTANLGLLENMQNEGFFGQAAIVDMIPKTIIESIELTRLLGQQYIWVDCICIVQDDLVELKEQLQAMASIYANACLTLVATTGASDAGLRGIEGITTHFLRPTDQSASLHEAIQQEYDNVASSAWHARGWTFQEQILSRRIIVLGVSSISWECHCAVWLEGMDPNDVQCGAVDHIAFQGPSAVSNADIQEYARHVQVYNMRDLSFSDDIVRAFVGILTALRSGFSGGFACGIPLNYFDLALMWRNTDVLSKRQLTRGELNDRSPLPTWSWMLWRGTLLLDSWTDDHYKHIKPLVQWRYKTSLGDKWKFIPSSPAGPNCHKDEHRPPLSWQMQQCPLYLYCCVERGFFFVDEKPTGVYLYSPADQISLNVSTTSELHAGKLTATSRGWHSPGTRCEVVAISETTVPLDFTIGVTKLPTDDDVTTAAAGTENPTAWINVLWIEWYKGVAYRQGVGQISKTVWQREDLDGRIENIDLVLG